MLKQTKFALSSFLAKQKTPLHNFGIGN